MAVYELRTQIVRELVPKNVPGSYILADVEDEGFQVGYIGRSDNCLRTRLLCHARTGRYPLFTFRTCVTREEAFKRECYLYHTYTGLENHIHPATNGTAHCPICAVVSEFSNALEVEQ